MQQWRQSLAAYPRAEKMVSDFLQKLDALFGDAMEGLESVSPNTARVLGRKAFSSSTSGAFGSTNVTSMPSFFSVTAKRLNVPP